MGAVIVGVDIGQKRDPTAVCVAELERREGERRREEHFNIRHLERLQLGTSFTAVAERIGTVSAGVMSRSRDPLWIYVDATGLGLPVVELIREQVRTRRVIPVHFTHGDRRTVSKDQGHQQVSLGKAYLVSRLQALFQSNRLHLPRSREAEALIEELLNFEIRVDENANDKYGAFRVGTHDDLVTALGLAVHVTPIDPVAHFDGARSRLRKRRRTRRSPQGRRIR